MSTRVLNSLTIFSRYPTVCNNYSKSLYLYSYFNTFQNRSQETKSLYSSNLLMSYLTCAIAYSIVCSLYSQSLVILQSLKDLFSSLRNAVTSVLLKQGLLYPLGISISYFRITQGVSPTSIDVNQGLFFPCFPFSREDSKYSKLVLGIGVPPRLPVTGVLSLVPSYKAMFQ